MAIQATQAPSSPEKAARLIQRHWRTAGLSNGSSKDLSSAVLGRRAWAEELAEASHGLALTRLIFVRS